MYNLVCRLRRGRLLLPIGVAAFGLLALPAGGAAAGYGTTRTQAEAVEHSFTAASKLIGAELRDMRGDTLGQIDEVVLNRQLDRVAYAVLALKAEANRNIAIPLTALRRDADDMFTTDLSASDVRRGPKFEAHKWSEMSSPEFEKQVDELYMKRSARFREQAARYEIPAIAGAEAHEGMSPPASKYQKLTHLIGLDVKTKDGETVGNIECMTVEMQEGRILYGFLSVSTLPGGDKMAFVPWQALEVRPRQAVARLDSDRKTLESIAFSTASFPNLQDRTYASRIYQAFAREPYWQVYGYAPREKDPAAAWKTGSDFNRLFNTEKMRKYEGTVESVGTFVPEPGAADGLRLRVKTTTGQLITVFAGPKSYAEHSGLMLHYGDKVMVMGSETMVNNRSVVLATQVDKEARTYRMREYNGQPLWQPGDIQ